MSGLVVVLQKERAGLPVLVPARWPTYRAFLETPSASYEPWPVASTMYRKHRPRVIL